MIQAGATKNPHTAKLVIRDFYLGLMTQKKTSKLSLQDAFFLSATNLNHSIGESFIFFS
jgi:hypothetical protein